LAQFKIEVNRKSPQRYKCTCVCVSFSDCEGVQWRCEKDESHWGADQHWENSWIQVKGTHKSQMIHCEDVVLMFCSPKHAIKLNC